jgi:hypothetical protein
MYDGGLERNLINYAIELLKMIVSVIFDGYPKLVQNQMSKGMIWISIHGYGNEWILATTVDMVTSEYLL